MIRKYWRVSLRVAACAALAIGTTQAQIQPEIRDKVREIGRVIDPINTAPLYRPLHPNPPYQGVSVTRDVSYGSDPRQVLDLFKPQQAGGGPRPVLIYVPGGPGARIEPWPGGDAFYDNIGLWAVKNGMIAVNVQRRSGQGLNWDSGAEDVSNAVQWVRRNAAQHGGDPNRVFAWGHSAGASALANYLGHARLHGPDGVGLKGAILMSGNVNIAPVRVNAPPAQFNPALFAGRPGPGGAPAGGRPGGAAGGRPGGAAGGPPGGAPAGGPPAGGPPGGAPDPAVQLQRSNLPGLQKSEVPLFLIAGELDPLERVELVKVLGDELCKVNRCPQRLIVPDHGHMSIVFAVNTSDESSSKPLLDWMRSIR